MQENDPLKIVIDTNLWISFIISNKLHLLDPLLFSGKIRLLFSAELIEEIEATIQKPKLKKYFGSDALDKMLTAFDPYIDFIKVLNKVSACRDQKDNFLLSLAQDGEADFLLSGDQDLLVLEQFGKTQIITITGFLMEVTP